jgi:hypothetical protein
MIIQKAYNQEMKKPPYLLAAVTRSGQSAILLRQVRDCQINFRVISVAGAITSKSQEWAVGLEDTG